jgi:hypothetical protein
VLLQCPTEVDELFRPGNKGAHSNKVVLLGSLGLDMTVITFLAHPSQGMLQHRQSILPCGDRYFPAFHLPLSGKELLAQLNSRRRRCHRA